MLFLGFIDKLKEYFLNFDFFDLIPVLMGMVAGFMICLLIYLLIVVTSLKKSEKKHKKIIDVSDEEINRIISNTRNKYIDEASSVKTSEKVIVLKDCCIEMLTDISKTYYPKSKHPLFELSIEEIINLDYYIMKRIEGIFDKRLLRKVKSLKITSVLNLIDKTKMISENKAVKAANKAKVPTIAKGVITTLNLFNPVYWVKKAMIDTPYQIILNKIAYTIIDVVGEETSKIYSKRLFVVEDKNNNINLEEEINQLKINELIGED